jgi:hypothetical protein
MAICDRPQPVIDQRYIADAHQDSSGEEGVTIIILDSGIVIKQCVFSQTHARTDA